jgi:hypothetical protein
LLAPRLRPTKSPYHWDTTAAIGYADRYSGNYGVLCWNRSYQYLTNDCTNFMSEALLWGTFHTTTVWTPYTSAWAYVLPLYNWLLYSISTPYASVSAVYSGSGLSAAYTAANKGDIYMYDWGKGRGWSHMSMAVGWGPRPAPYTADGTGDYMDQHTIDRWHAAWNYGYLHPDSSIDRTKMKVMVLSIKGMYY